MEENTNNINEDTAAEEVMERKQYTKQQNALYTVISIVLFFVIYFGGKGIMGLVNRPYTVYLYPENISAETMPMMFDISGLSSENGLYIENARLYKYEDGHTASILFSGFDSEEEFAESCILFEYGDLVEDLRIEFFPYEDNPSYAEYAFGTQYVDIDDPNRSVSVFEFDDTLYALYTVKGGAVPTEIKAAFSDGEKVY